MSLKSIAQRVAESRASGGGNWIKQGKGVLIVKSLYYGMKPEFYQGETFVAELYVEKSESFPDAFGDDGKTPEVANAPGSSISYLQQFENTRTKDVALPNTRAFFNGILDETEGSMSADAFAAAFDDIVDSKDRKFGKARGLRVAYSTYRKKSKEDKWLTLVKWEPVKGQTAEMIAQARALLDGVAAPVAAPAA